MASSADLLITNARVFTADPSNPWAEAVAVGGNRILFVGSAADARTFAGPRTEVVDAAGRTLLPGFIDTHYHLLWGSLGLAAAQLGEAHSLDAIAEHLLAWMEANPQREWVVGRGLIYSAIRPGEVLDRHFLDRLSPDRPVFLTAFDGHTCWANTEALRRADLLHAPAVSEGSEIVADPATGLATGELREPGAFEPIRSLVPKPDEAGRRAMLGRGLELTAQMGITSVHNMDGQDSQLLRYAALEDLGELTCRVYLPYDVKPETPAEALQEAVAWREKFTGDMLHCGSVKFFMDGVLESYTALMVDGFGDMPDNRCSALFQAEHFNRMAAEADRLGLQIFVHACGDGAVRRTLDGYAHARRVNGARDSRHRVEHIEVIHPDDIPRFAELDVVASMQPLHAPQHAGSSHVWVHRAGEERYPLSFAWETLRQAGTRLIYGSDWPVVSNNPLLGIYNGLNRQPWRPGDPEQRQALEDLLIGYTRDAAWAEFQEDRKGMLRAGFLADLALLSGDIFATPAEEVGGMTVDLTVCDGRVVWRGA